MFISQAGILDIESANPQIPTQFNADSGNAIPLANVLEILGGDGIDTSASGNTVIISGEDATAAASAGAANKGIASFDSSMFTVTSGFVQLLGSGQGIDSFTPDSGTSPVVPNLGGDVSLLGSGSITTVGGLNSITTQLTGLTDHAVLVGAGTTTITKLAVGNNGQVLIGANGADPAFGTLTSSDSSITFTTGANSLSLQVAGGSTVGKTITGDSGGALSPTGGNWNILGASPAAGTSPVITSGTASTLTVNVQKSQALASTDATKIGLCNFDSSAFDVDANGFVQLNNGGIATTNFDVQANTGPGTDPVIPTATGSIIVNGAAVANHSVVLETRSRAANTYNLEIQYATTSAATDATKSGVAHFDSTDFSVDANGFVALAGAGAGQTITGQSGGALSPTGGNWNISGTSTSAGTSPVVTSGVASTLTVNVQTSQAIAATDASKIGLCNFNSSQFSVDANGFVTLAGGGLAIDSIHPDSGTDPITPTAGGLVNILGATVAAGTAPLTSVGSLNTLTITAQRSQAISSADSTKVGLSNYDRVAFTVDSNGFVDSTYTKSFLFGGM